MNDDSRNLFEQTNRYLKRHRSGGKNLVGVDSGSRGTIVNECVQLVVKYFGLRIFT